VLIDAASNTGVDHIRELVQFAPVQCRYKVYVIDECQRYRLGVQFFLKPGGTAKSCGICTGNNRSPAVLPAIISPTVRLRRIPLEAMVRKIASIEKKHQHYPFSSAAGGSSVSGDCGCRCLRPAEFVIRAGNSRASLGRLGYCSEPDLIELLQAIARNNNPEAVLDYL